MPEKVKVIYFPKLCKTCRAEVKLVRKFSGMWWFECTANIQHDC